MTDTGNQCQPDITDAELASWARQWHWNDTAEDKPVDPSIYFRDKRMLRAFVEFMASRAQPQCGVQNGGDQPRDELIESIQYAIGTLSMHIEAYHDFDYQPHEVPPELAELRRLQHHLEGSLISSTGEIASTASSAEPTIREIVNELRGVAAQQPAGEMALVMSSADSRSEPAVDRYDEAMAAIDECIGRNS
jgi:hypothetical protein